MRHRITTDKTVEPAWHAPGVDLRIQLKRVRDIGCHHTARTQSLGTFVKNTQEDMQLSMKTITCQEQVAGPDDSFEPRNLCEKHARRHENDRSSKAGSRAPNRVTYPETSTDPLGNYSQTPLSKRGGISMPCWQHCSKFKAVCRNLHAAGM